MDTSETWRVPADVSSTCANLGWWEQFNDPVLSQLILEALENNLDLKVAAERVLQYYARVGIAESRLYPEVDLQSSAFKQQTSQALFVPLPGLQRINDAFAVLLSASYEVDIFGRIRSGIEAADAQFWEQEETRRGVVLTVVSSVAARYIELLEYDMQLKISQETLASRHKSTELAKLRFKEGLTSEIEVMQAEALEQEAAADMLQFELLIAEDENLISVLLGKAPTSIPRGNALDGLSQPPAVPAGLPSDLVNQRPDILASEQRLYAATAQIGIVMADYFPTFSLTGNYGFESLALKTLFTNPMTTWQYGAALFDSIFTGWRTTNLVAEAEAVQLQAAFEYVSTVLNGLREVEDALVSHQKAIELEAVQAKRVKVLKVYLNLAQLQYNNGQTDYLTVLDAERTLFRAQLDHTAAEADIFLSLVLIYKSLGGGWVIEAERVSEELWQIAPCEK